MNVIIANKRKGLLDKLDIDIIKSVDGEYSVDELISMFTNFFFNKMIVDITAIKDFNNINNIKKFTEAVDVNKVILLLGDSSLESSKEFISDLISMGIYNFTQTLQGVMDLYNKPNTYDDVKMYHSDTSFSTLKTEKKDIALYDEALEFNEDLRIIGVQDLTDGAGATTLVVQMVKQLNINYPTIGIELNKQDFIFFTSPFLYSCTSKADAIKKINEHKECKVVIIDLNKFDDTSFCNDVIYLVEPSTIKLTKLMKRNRVVFDNLRGKKIILNKTALKEKDVSEFETEIGTRVFACVNNFNDRSERVLTVDSLLVKLGFTKQYVGDGEAPKKRGFFSRH